MEPQVLVSFEFGEDIAAEPSHVFLVRGKLITHEACHCLYAIHVEKVGVLVDHVVELFFILAEVIDV